MLNVYVLFIILVEDICTYVITCGIIVVLLKSLWMLSGPRLFVRFRLSTSEHRTGPTEPMDEQRGS